MSFNSIAFLVFIGLFFSLWPLVREKRNPKFLFLIVASFVFYGWWDWRFLFLIIGSGLIDYLAAKMIAKHPAKARLYLILSLIGNLGSLSVFKYSGFIATQADHILQKFYISFSLYESLPEFTYILPVGISFYTFQSMSYTIDVYRGKLKPTRNLLHFFAYLVLFPQLVAGPIVRAKDFLGQLVQVRTVSGVQFWNGCKLIILGYFQKTVVADNLGVLVDGAYAGTISGEGLFWWVVMLCFAFQIYFDFCGYSQIARGLAKLMGYHFRMNFNHPYHALSLRDFWTRWHISLSTWFRDYIYIPLGGSKNGRVKAHRNMWITMLLSGLWHGAAWNFILWGGFHAAVLSLERILGKTGINSGKAINWAVTFVVVILGWVLFRAENLDQIQMVLSGMFTANTSLGFVEANLNPIIFLAVGIIYEAGYYITKDIPLRQRNALGIGEALLFALILAAILFFRGPEQEFIYFQF